MKSTKALLALSLALILVSPSQADCPEDLDGDGWIGLQDLAILLGRYGQPGGEGDINEDGVVDIIDLAILLGVYNTPCP